VVACSDQHFGAKDNILLPGRGKDMSGGWETKRSRVPGHCDWIIVRLGAPGHLKDAEIDTAYFKGNFPESVMLDGCFSDLVSRFELFFAGNFWKSCIDVH